jgi:leucyl-tRNA---protein transferase
MDEIQFFQSFFQQNLLEINQHFYAQEFSLREWEKLLAKGWRHNGQMIYRTSRDLNEEDGSMYHVVPLRYRLKNFEMSKSQRKIWRQNQDLTYDIKPLNITDEIHALFKQHTSRFKHRVPDSIFDFVTSVPNSPFISFQLEIRKESKLIAITFFDYTRHALSSTYAAFDLAESKRSLGIYTLLLEIHIANANKKAYHYPGYTYREPSLMDYKKRFKGVEYFDWWNEWWLPFTE